MATERCPELHVQPLRDWALSLVFLEGDQFDTAADVNITDICLLYLAASIVIDISCDFITVVQV